MLHHAALKLCFWLMHMFEILKFEFVVWMDLNSIEKIKRKENRNFRIKEKAKTAQDALSLDLFVQARMRSLSLHGGTRLSVSFLSPTRVPVAPSPSASPVPPIGAARSLACPLLRWPMGHACQPCPPQPSARTTHAHAVDSAPTMHTKATPAPTRPFLAARTPTHSPSLNRTPYRAPTPTSHCNTPSNPWTGVTYSWQLARIIYSDQHESFVCTFTSLMRIRENFPVGHPSQIARSQARLTWMFFRDRLSKKKMHLVGMDTLLILLSFGPGYHHPRGQDITIHPP
jgi:hypothetical protein